LGQRDLHYAYVITIIYYMETFSKPKIILKASLDARFFVDVHIYHDNTTH